MAVAYREEVVHALLQALGVVGIDHTAQEHAHGLEAELLCPTQFLVDGGVIVGVFAPHLNLVDGVGGDVVAARQPRVLLVPVVSLLCTPTAGQRLCLSRTCEKEQERQHRQQGNLQVILHSFFSYKMVIDDVLSWTVCVLGHLGRCSRVIWSSPLVFHSSCKDKYLFSNHQMFFSAFSGTSLLDRTRYDTYRSARSRAGRKSALSAESA